MALDFMEAALEAVLFAAGEPVEEERLAQALGDGEHPLEIQQVRDIAGRLMLALDDSASGIRLVNLGTSYQLVTRTEYADMIKAALEIKRNTPLSNAAMETLTIIAYNQPVTKGFVERVRGVDSGSVVNTLVERGLLEEAGRIEVPGRPVTYRTTAHFLRAFGLQSLEDLPPLPTSAEPDLFDMQTEEMDADEASEENASEMEMDNLETIESDGTAGE